VTDYVDTHCHLQEPEFAEDLEALLARARDAGVVQMVLPGVDLETSESALALARRYDGLYATAGFHPHEASRLTDEALARIDALLSDERVVAVGEIGLDYFRNHSTHDQQMACLDRMLLLSERHTKPIVVHCRDAWEAIAPVLQPWAQRVAPAFAGRPVGVLHYYSSDIETAERYVKLDFLVSIHTSVTHPKASALREVAAALPLEALVIETDSPYGAPQPVRGKRNEPMFVIEAARQVAEAKGISIEEVAAATTANARRLFGLSGSGVAPGPGEAAGVRTAVAGAKS
jgi:TatD DNase family protein